MGLTCKDSLIREFFSALNNTVPRGLRLVESEEGYMEQPCGEKAEYKLNAQRIVTPNTLVFKGHLYGRIFFFFFALTDGISTY